MDRTRRGIACGWPGQPERHGIFLTASDIADAHFFVRMGDGRTIDVWRVDVTGVPLIDLSDEGGWWLCPEPIPVERLQLVEVWETSGIDEPRQLPLPRDH